MALGSEVKDASDYFKKFSEILKSTKASLGGGAIIELSHATRYLINLLADTRINKKRLMVIGNGGSAGIAMHALADYANAGKFKTVDFYNPALLTCMSNDYGYENVFARPVEMFADSGDMLFAISSSGKSPNIVAAAKTAKSMGCDVITFSGFSPDNPLRKIGKLNFYTPSSRYGFVELAHQTLIHCVLDLFVSRENMPRAHI